MRHQGFARFTPWQLVERRFFDSRSPHILAFSQKHGLNIIEVMRLFCGETISFSLKMCEALSKETGMSKDFFRNLSNRWPPHPPPAASAALLGGSFLFAKCCN